MASRSRHVASIVASAPADCSSKSASSDLSSSGESRYARACYEFSSLASPAQFREAAAKWYSRSCAARFRVIAFSCTPKPLPATLNRHSRRERSPRGPEARLVARHVELPQAREQRVQVVHHARVPEGEAPDANPAPVAAADGHLPECVDVDVLYWELGTLHMIVFQPRKNGPSKLSGAARSAGVSLLSDMDFVAMAMGHRG